MKQCYSFSRCDDCGLGYLWMSVATQRGGRVVCCGVVSGVERCWAVLALSVIVVVSVLFFAVG